MKPVQSFNPITLLQSFRAYLAKLSLGTISRKLYLADIKRFLGWIKPSSINPEELSLTQTYLDYLSQPSISSSPTLSKRTLASLRQFGSFVSTTYGLPNALNNLSFHNSTPLRSTNNAQSPFNKYINTYTDYLNSLQLSSGTIKSYKSDAGQYLSWLIDSNPSSLLSSLLIEKNIEKYLNHLSEQQTVSVATIDRKAKSLLKFSLWMKAHYPQVMQSDKHENNTLSNYISPTLHPALTSNISLTSSPEVRHNSVKKFNYRNLRSILPIFILLLLTSTLTIFGYRQFSSEVKLTAAYPSTPVTPNRQLSFQGRLETAGGTPITTATNLTFKLFDASSGGTELYSTGTCSITPDSDGVFNTQIGDTCGAAITSSVFTENQDVWLEVTVAAETLTPRQQIATVAYALNSETLQGFPLSSTVSAIRNTVVPMNQWGEIIVGEQSPRMTGVSGTFQISAPALSFTTTTGSNGNITLAPDGTGQVNLNGNTTSTSFFNVSNAQLTTGSLITGTAATNNTGFNLINLLSGSSPTSKFSVTDTGLTTVGADLYVSSGVSLYNNAVSDDTVEALRFCTGDGETNCVTDFSALVSGSSLFTDGGTVTYLTSTTDDFAIGGTTVAASMFSIDESAGNFYFGSDNSANPTLNFEATDSDAGEFGFNTNDSFYFTNANLGVGTAAPAGKFEVSDTSNTLASATITNNTATTLGAGGNTLGVFDLQSTSLTTGNLFNAEANALTSGKLLNLSSTSTALTTGNLASIDWSPGSSTTSTGDLFKINIGANGSASTLFNVLDTSSSLFSISETALISNLPTSFTSPGDVSIAYDLVFTNPTASYVKSAAPLYIQAGETFNSSNLNLQTYNKGNTIVDSEAFVANHAATISGQLVVGTATAPANIGEAYLTNASTFGKALLILNQTESQDILTASASGTPKLTINSAGALTLIDGVAHTIDDVSGNLSLTSNSTYVSIADDLQITGGDILDANGNEHLRFGTTASAVNELTLTNAAASGTVALAATGGDTDIALNLDSKGADAININGVATGDVNLAGGSGSTGCTIANSTGNLTCTGTISGATVSSKWNSIIDPDGNSTLAHAAYTTTMSWTSTGALNAWTTNFNNNSTSSTTQNALVINNANVGSFTDTNTESLVLLQQLDSNLTGATVLGSALKIDAAADSGITNGINITNSAGSITTGININDTAGGSISTGIALSGTFTSAGIDAGNSIITNIGNAGTDFTGSGGLTLASDVTISSGDLYIGAIGLNDVGVSNVTSGASLVGTFDEFDYSSSTTVQAVLNDLDAQLAGIIAGSSGVWTDAGTLTYLTSTADDFAIGGTTLAASMFGIDESAGNFYFGYDNSANPTLNFEATDADAGEFGFNTDDSFYFSNANVGIGDTSPDAKTEILSTTEQLRLSYTDNTVDSRFTVDSSGDLTINNTGTKTIVADDFQITGDDLFMNTNTAGMLLIADGTNFNPTAMSGDITINGSGVTAIGADKITEAMLKSVNGPTDELCLSYESSVGDFEWQTCGGGASSWTDAGTYLYPTSGEVLGNSVSGGANKIAGLYLADSAPLVFGTDNDFTFSFSGSTLGSTLAAGTLFGINTTSALATLDVRGNLGTVPNASISGNTAMASLVVDQSGIGDLFTASKSGDTKFVITNAGNVGIGVAAPTNKLEIGGSTSTISNASGDITIDSASNSISFAGDSLVNILNTYVSGELGLGLADAVAKLDVHGAVVGKALVMFNEIGDQDILTASASGNTRARLTNTGSLSLDGDYINYGLTDGSSGYGFRDNAGTLEFKNLAGSWTGIGTGGASWWDQTTNGTLQPYNKTVDLLLGGTATSSAKFAVLNMNSGTPTASISGNMIIGQGDYLGSEYGPLNLAYKSGLNAWTTGIVLQDSTGNVGIGVSNPTQKLEVNGYIVGQRFVDSSSSSNYLDPADSTTSLAILGDINNTDTTAEFKISSSNNQNIKIDAGSGTVTIGAAGAGKLDAGTIDPPYTINGAKYATYMSSMTGVKEETTGVIKANEYVLGQGYRATLNFAESLTGSDLWLFAKVTDLENNLPNLVVLSSAEGNTPTWYKVDPNTGKLYLYASSPVNISYRLTAPRFDASDWANSRNSDSIGFEVNDDETWSVSDQVRNFFSNETNITSPLTESAPVEIVAPIMIKPENDSFPALTVEGEIEADSISAREIQIEQATISGTLYADKIVSPELDQIKSSISDLESSISATITEKIKERLDALLGNEPSAQDLSSPPEATESSQSSPTYDPPLLNDDLSTSLTTDLAIVNNYLAVIGSATITSLDVTANIYASRLESKDGLLALQPEGIINMGSNTLIVDATTGQVFIDGDLSVSGKFLANSAELGELSIGTPATESSLANLLSIYDEQGKSVATIDASGSANLASLTTNMITIASPAVASESAGGLANLIGTAQSNATAGQSILLSPNTELTIESPHITPNSLVYLTPTTNTDNKVLFVKSKVSCPAPNTIYDLPSTIYPCTPSFTVAIDAPASADIQFNWWIIQLSENKAL